MKLDDVLMLAGVDGNLLQRESRGVKQAIARSERAKRNVSLLRASRLRYREAYEHVKSSPVPQRLSEQTNCRFFIFYDAVNSLVIQKGFAKTRLSRRSQAGFTNI
jgi:hypothetical protein